MIVWGGIDGDRKVLGDGAKYDPKTNTWSSIATTGAPAPRMRHVAVWTARV